jgi:hypothetical protein
MKIFKYFGYSKWEDVGLEYIVTDYKWVIIQTRTRNRDNYRQFRDITIMRWGGQLSDNVKNKLNEIMFNK